MKHLSLLTALMLSSSMVCAGWTPYHYNPQTSTYTSIPNFSCLEMLCESGCVENADTGEGYCCPSGTNTTYLGGAHPVYSFCKCPENQTWDTITNGCSCSFGTTQYTNYLGEKACCNTTTYTLCDITGTQNKSCCPNESPYLDANFYRNNNNCVPCPDGKESPEGSGSRNSCK